MREFLAIVAIPVVVLIVIFGVIGGIFSVIYFSIEHEISCIERLGIEVCDEVFDKE